MKSTSLIVVAIGMVIGFALAPVISSNVTSLTEEPGCSAGDPFRLATAGTLTLATGFNGIYDGSSVVTATAGRYVVCAANQAAAVSALSTTSRGPDSSGGVLNSLYAGVAPRFNPQPTSGPLIAAASIVDLIPLLYIAGILIVPIAMLGFRYMRR